jgi:hypothetical protein
VIVEIEGGQPLNADRESPQKLHPRGISMKKAATCIFLLLLVAIPMIARNQRHAPAAGPMIYIEPSSTTDNTNQVAMCLRNTITGKRVPVQFTSDKGSARYVLRYEGEDYKDCARLEPQAVAGTIGASALVCVGWNTGTRITSVKLVDATTQQVIWSDDLKKWAGASSFWPGQTWDCNMAEVAKRLKHFLEKENNH